MSLNKSTIVEKKIEAIYTKVFKEVFNDKNLLQLLKSNPNAIQQKIVDVTSSKKYEEFARKFSLELAKKGLQHEKGLWRKYFQAARKAHYIALPKTFTEFEDKVLKEAVEENFKMIKTIPEKTMEIVNRKYTSTLIEEVVKGTKTRGTFKKELLKHGATNAKVIARTEAAKLQTFVLEKRATDLGSVVYRWRSSNDKRTRPSHREMNGVIVFWKFEPPHLDKMFGHAGEFPNCRCSPNPIFDEDDLVENSYKVYNYNTEKIVTMNKKALITALKAGHL